MARQVNSHRRATGPEPGGGKLRASHGGKIIYMFTFLPITAIEKPTASLKFIL
jgi:hypothetical protein